MELKSILQLIKAVEETDFDKFELTDKEFSLKLERNDIDWKLARNGEPFMIAPPQAMPAAAPAAAQAAAPVVPAAEETPAAEKKIPNAKDIVSPLVGIFHELPGGKVVKIGDKLKKGDVVCMVEAMKLMNEIVMPEDGEIVWVAAGENDTVEYEQILYRYVK